MKNDSPDAGSFVKPKPGLSRWLAAFRNTYDGLIHALKNEAALREELLLLVLSVPFALLLVDSWAWRVSVVTSVLILLAVEALNTAIETTLDKISTEFCPITKAAKDLGSMAVFCMLVVVALVWTGAFLAT